MILYVNGDSHSTGHDAVMQGITCPEEGDSEEIWEFWDHWNSSMKKNNLEVSYGNVLAKKLNAKFVCEAEAGCSNDTIIKRTVQYLESNTPDFIIIGWSTWEREEWIYQGQSYYISASGYDQLPEELHTKYKEFVVNADDPTVQKNKEIENHQKIYALHKKLKNRNIPHLFFNCYSYFFYIESHNLEKYDWGENYINPYQQNSTYYFWLEQQGFKPSNPKFYHYGADAHSAWAEFLLPKVQSLLTHNE